VTSSRPVPELLDAVRAGEAGADEALYAALYDDLRTIASRQLGSGGPATLGTTALVHETYLKLVDRSSISPESRRHFLAIAARAMRQLVVDYVRTARADKRGGGAAHIDLGDAEELLGSSSDPADRALEILEIDEALTELDRRSPRLRQVVELRFFAGFDVAATAEAMGSSERTVKRDWQIARAFLYRALHGESGATDEDAT